MTPSHAAPSHPAPSHAVPSSHTAPPSAVPQQTTPGAAPAWYVPSGATAPLPLASAPPPPPTGPYGQPVYGQPVYGQPVYGQPVYGQPTHAQPGQGRPGGGRPNRNGIVAAVVAGVLAIGGIAYTVGRDDAGSAAERSVTDRDREEDDGGRDERTPDTEVVVPSTAGGGGGRTANVPSDEVLATAYARLTATRPTEAVMQCLRQGASIAPTELTAVAQGTVNDFETAAAGVLALVDCAPAADAAFGVGESLAYLTGTPWDTGCLQQVWSGLDRGSRITLAAESMVDVQGYAADALAVFASCQI